MQDDTTTRSIHFDATMNNLFTSEPAWNSEERLHCPSTRLLSVALASLVFLYHAQNTAAQTLIQGSTSDDDVALFWEYDLDQGTGFVVILNRGIPLVPMQERVYFAGLLPHSATYINANWDVAGLNLCSGITAAPGFVAAHLQPLVGTKITFNLPSSSELVPMQSRVDYGTACTLPTYPPCSSSSFPVMGCFVKPRGSLSDFVTVQAIQPACDTPADFNCDGDTDLLDFARFQQLFNGDLPFTPDE